MRPSASNCNFCAPGFRVWGDIISYCIEQWLGWPDTLRPSAQIFNNEGCTWFRGIDLSCYHIRYTVYIWRLPAKSKQILLSGVYKSYACIWWSFDFKPFLLNDHYCKEKEVLVWRHSDNYFYIILIFEWSQVWFLASPFLDKL